MDVVSLLVDEHKTIQKALKSIKLFSEKLSQFEGVRALFIANLLDLFRTYVDRCHHGKEEAIFFKRLETKPLLKEEKQLLKELLDEHTLARSYVKELDQIKDTKDEKRLCELLEKMRTLYELHIYKENAQFFIPAFAYFSDAEKKAMLEECFAVDRRMVHERYQSVVHDLASFLHVP